MMTAKQAILSTLVVLPAVFCIPAYSDTRYDTVYIDSNTTESEITNILTETPIATSQTRGIRKQPVSDSGADTNAETNANSGKKVALGLVINFEKNSYDILPRYRDTLSKVGSVLSKQELVDKSITIEGHADASGEEVYNYELSFKRASAVRNYLINITNIDRSRLTPVPFGEEVLALPEDPFNEKNRRVLIVLGD